MLHQRFHSCPCRRFIYLVGCTGSYAFGIALCCAVHSGPNLALGSCLCRFIYLVGFAGAYAFGTALCGLAGVKRDRRLQLGAYILLLALLVSTFPSGQSGSMRALSCSAVEHTPLECEA